MSAAVTKNLETATRDELAAAASKADAPSPMPELNGLLLQLPGAPTIYLVVNGYRCGLPDQTTYQNLFVPGAMVVQDINIGVVAEGPVITSGAVLVQGSSSPQVYFVSNGEKMWIPTPTIFSRYQFNSAKIQVVAQILVDSIPSGPDVQPQTT
jgi:hypothetical protein